MNLFWNVVDSTWGEILIISNHKGLVRVTLPGDNVCKRLNDVSSTREIILTNKNTPLIQLAKKQIVEYFSGKRENFRLDLDPQGTDFQKSVWRSLQKIPYGETRSYQDIAVNVGNPKGARAVGLANNKNPLPIIIPCHRVIGKNGSLTGFGGGLPLKQRMLQLEIESLPNLKNSKRSPAVTNPELRL